MVLALRAAGVQPLGGSLERPAAEDGIALADVPGAPFLEVVEDFFRAVRRAGGLDVHAKKNDDGMKFKQRDNHVMGWCGARRMQAHNTHMCCAKRKHHVLVRNNALFFRLPSLLPHDF